MSFINTIIEDVEFQHFQGKDNYFSLIAAGVKKDPNQSNSGEERFI